MTSEKYTLAECARLLGQDVKFVLELVESGDLEHDLETGEVQIDGATLIRLALRRTEIVSRKR